MDFLLFIMAIGWFLVSFILPIVAIARANRQRDKAAALERELHQVKHELSQLKAEQSSQADTLVDMVAQLDSIKPATVAADAMPTNAMPVDVMSANASANDAMAVPIESERQATSDTAVSEIAASASEPSPSATDVVDAGNEQAADEQVSDKQDSTTPQPVAQPHEAATASSLHTPAAQSAKPPPILAASTTSTSATPTTSISASASTASSQQAQPRHADALIEPDEQSVDVVTSLVQSAKNWFTGGNMIVRVGVLVLLVGVVLLLRLASDYFETPIELRLSLVAIGGLALTALGLKLTKKRRNYGISLQGAGLAIIYLTLFSSFKVFGLLPAGLTFVLLALLSAASAYFAVKQNALPLALLAFGGGFFAPILTATESGNVVGLFAYYLVLNIALAWIAHFRTWKVLNALSVGVTFVLAYLWGAGDFSSEASEQLLPQVRWQLVALLAAHLALYIFIAVRYTQQLVEVNAKRQSTAQSAINGKLQKPPLPAVDAGLLFGVPVLGFGLLAGLLHEMPYVLAAASALLAAVYILIGNALIKRSQAYRLMTEGTLALGISFSALVIPLALSAEWTAVGWAVQGAGLVWLGVRTQKLWSTLFGLALQLTSFFVWLVMAVEASEGFPLAICVIATASMLSAYLMRSQDADLDDTAEDAFSQPPQLSQPPKSQSAPHAADTQPMSYAAKMQAAKAVRTDKTDVLPILVLLSATLVSYIALVVSCVELTADLTSSVSDHMFMVAMVVLLVFFLVMYQRLRWQQTGAIARCLLPVFGLCCLGLLSDLGELFDADWWWAVMLTMVGFVGLGLLWLRALAQHTATRIDQVMWLLLLLSMVAAYAAWSFDTLSELMVVVLPCVLLVILAQIAQRSTVQPVSFQRAAHATAGATSPPHGAAGTDARGLHLPQVLRDTSIILLPLALLWLLVVNYSSAGQYLGIPYLPMVSLLDISILLVVLYALMMYRLQDDGHVMALLRDSRMMLYSAIGVVGFWTLSSMLVRTLHQWAGSPSWIDGAWQSDMVQTGFTLLWMLLALIFTVLASRRAWREVWLVGIGLLGLVVIKLILIDLSNSSALLRVVSFIVAGLLMLLIGYFAPLPPKRPTDSTKHEEVSHDDA